jgi:plastocyanin
MNRNALAAGVLATLLGLTACSSSGNNSAGAPPATQPASSSQPATSSQPPATSGPTITIQNFGYSGALSVKAGTKVTVVNNDTVAHTLTDKDTHKFDTGSISGSGGTGTFTAPDKPGKYPFGCLFHPEMSGTLTVTS